MRSHRLWRSRVLWWPLLQPWGACLHHPNPPSHRGRLRRRRQRMTGVISIRWADWIPPGVVYTIYNIFNIGWNICRFVCCHVASTSTCTPSAIRTGAALTIVSTGGAFVPSNGMLSISIFRSRIPRKITIAPILEQTAFFSVQEGLWQQFAQPSVHSHVSRTSHALDRMADT